jgi:hypothetical protein
LKEAMMKPAIIKVVSTNIGNSTTYMLRIIESKEDVDTVWQQAERLVSKLATQDVPTRITIIMNITDEPFPPDPYWTEPFAIMVKEVKKKRRTYLARMVETDEQAKQVKEEIQKTRSLLKMNGIETQVLMLSHEKLV